MGSGDREVKLTIRVSDDGTLSVLDAAGRKVDEFGRKASAAGQQAASGLSRTQVTIIALNQALELARRTWHAVEGVVGTAIHNAAEFERQQMMLNTALQASGQYTPKLSADLQQLAKSMMMTSTYTKEQVMDIERFLVLVGVTAPRDVEVFTRA